MTLVPERVEEFFATARERHSIYLRRQAGQAVPYTDDPIFQHWRFCNVFREIDKTTVWFRENVREPMRSKPEVLLATVVFRFFNRIGVGEAIFKQLQLGPGSETAWETFLRSGDIVHMKRAIINYVGLGGPYVTGSYIISSPAGLGKLDGVLKIVEWFNQDYRQFQIEWNKDCTLQGVTEWLVSKFRFIGHFIAYEIVSDLRHTDLLSRAPDIITWANPGPGATRGLNYLYGRVKTPSKGQLVEEMQELLVLSRHSLNWHRYTDERFDDWPAWEMREVEHWLCEYFKWSRARDTGRGPRQRFKP